MLPLILGFGLLLAGCDAPEPEIVPISPSTPGAVETDAPSNPSESPVPSETESPENVLPEPESEFAELYCTIVENEGKVSQADVDFALEYADKVEAGEIPGGEFLANDLRFFASQIEASIDNNDGQLFPSRFQDAVNACNSVS